MISFSPSEDQAMMQGAVAQMARTVLRPRMRECEVARALPEDIRKTAHEMGLGMAALPGALGGAGLGLTTAALLEEEVAWGDPAAAFGFGGPGAAGLAVAELGTEEQAKNFLAPFADAGGESRFGAAAWGEPKAVAERAGLATVAKQDGDGWVLSGEKAYVLNADRADTFVVFAEVDPAKGMSGVGAFVVKKGAAGLTIGARATTLGLDVASFGSLTLRDVRVAGAD